MTSIHQIVTTPNTEDPEVGGFFAYWQADFPLPLDQFDSQVGTVDLPADPIRGFGCTELEAAACLISVQAEQEGETWVYDPQFV